MIANKSALPPTRKDLPDVSTSRSIRQQAKMALIAVAGGRCEFRGCPVFLFAHSVTKAMGYFGNYAHIRAFSDGGPRAGAPHERDGVDLNEVSNLMLLCPGCHILVDSKVEEYTISDLHTMKRAHEERVAYLLQLPEENEASLVEIWTSVSNPPVVRDFSKLIAAMLPLYPSRRSSCLIDLSAYNLSDPALIPAATEQIDRDVGHLFSAQGERPTHIAVFGITTIPLLVHLGARLGDRLDVLLFQYHRDTKDWKWKNEPSRAQYEVRRARQGRNPTRVAVAIALSGTIDMDDLSGEIDASYSLYEITLMNEAPHTGFLRTKGDLDRFRDCWRRFQAHLQVDHGSLAEIAVVPAVPIPVAIALGMDRLPKVAPSLQLYDLDKNMPGVRSYRRVLRVR